MLLQFARHPSPLGQMLLAWDESQQLRALDFDDCEARLNRLLQRHYGSYELCSAFPPTAITERLDGYFAGAIAKLSEISVATGGTDFQRQVWTALRTIEPGATTSYGELAARLGRRGASRAVGLANGSNPVAIVVPCHRVIGASGALTGYGGGLGRKQWLLDHERRFADRGCLLQ
jgi:methylated-DNA-[protein]-cysteine S-methyltransferase